MLIQETHQDVATKADGKEGSMSMFYARSGGLKDEMKKLIDDWQESSFFILPFLVTLMRNAIVRSFEEWGLNFRDRRFPGVVLFSEIYQVTGPVARFARQIAGQGYIVAAPSSYHEFVSSEPLAYDVPGTDAGNEYKIKKTLAGYDEDSTLSIDLLLSLPTCTGRIGATGMCLGGHLAYRCALDPRISAAVTYFATDLHSATLGLGMKDDSLARAGEIKAELAMIHGTKDNHVPPEGRDLIRKTLRDKGVVFSWYEVAGAQHAFIRDELSKGRYDPAISKICFEILLELFGRTLKIDLGGHDGKVQKIEDIC